MSLTGKRGGLKDSAAEEIGGVVKKIVEEKIKKLKEEMEVSIKKKIEEEVEKGSKMVINAMEERLEGFYKKLIRKTEEKQEEEGAKMKSVIGKNVFARLGEQKENEESKAGLKSGTLGEEWRVNLEYRKRLIRISRGLKYEHAIERAAIWFEGWLREEDKKDVRVVKSSSIWIECKNLEVKERIMECKREMRKLDGYRIDDVMTDIERKSRFKVEDYAASIKVKGTTIKREWDKIRINNTLYGWNEAISEIYFVKE